MSYKKLVYVLGGLVLIALVAVGLTGTALALDKIWTSADMVPATAPTYALEGSVALTLADVKECPAEISGTCWTARIRNIDGGYLRFWWVNPSNLWQDGYRYEPTVGMLTGVPPMWAGYVEGFSFRPTGSLPGEDVPSSLPLAAPAKAASTTAKTTDLSPSASVSMTFPAIAWTVMDGSKSRVRATASLSGTEVAMLEQGTQITLTSLSGDWYGVMEPNGYIKNIRVQFNDPTKESAAPVSASATAAATLTTDLSAYGVTLLEGQAEFVSCNDGTAICWADWKNPVKVKLEVPQDGEYFLSGNSGETKSPVPAGTWHVTGLTLRVGGNGK